MAARIITKTTCVDYTTPIDRVIELVAMGCNFQNAHHHFRLVAADGAFTRFGAFGKNMGTRTTTEAVTEIQAQFARGVLSMYAYPPVA